MPDVCETEALVCAVATLLARQGAAGLPEALALVVQNASLRSAVLRRPGAAGELLAGAGEVVQSLPLQRRETAVVELPVRDAEGGALATLTLTGSRPGQLPALRGVALVLSLVVEPVRSVDPGLAAAAALLADAEAERDALADALHDGPVQELVAARWAADHAARSGDATLVREAVQVALVALRRTLWQLRPRGTHGLVDALSALSERLVEGGGPPLELHVDPDADVLAPSAAVVVYRLVQSVTATPGTSAPEGAGPVVVDVRRHDAPGGRQVVVTTVDSGLTLRDAPRWSRAAAALGGDLLLCRGSLRLTLPAAPSLPPLPSPSSRGPGSTGTVQSGTATSRTAPTAKAVL